METTLFEIKLLDGRIFRVFCRGKNQKKRFNKVLSSLTILDTNKEITNGIHTIEEFEKCDINGYEVSKVYKESNKYFVACNDGKIFLSLKFSLKNFVLNILR